MNPNTKSFFTAFAIGAVIAVVVCVIESAQSVGAAQLLCDGFFVAGVLIAGSGGLAFVRNQGMFDIFSFGVRSLFGVHFHWVDKEKEKETYADYRERKSKNRKSPVGTLLAGAVYLGLSGILLIIYYL